MPRLLRIVLLFCAASAALVAATWPVVPPVDFTKIAPSDFSADDLELVTPLAHFTQVANAVVEDGPDRGFIKIAVWRSSGDNRPYNARIQENIIALAWFYTADRAWNPYRGHPAVCVRLEAALDYIARIQNDDGRFSEFAPQKWNLAATAFMTKFLGETLELLDAAAKTASPVTIDPGVLARAHATWRKALVAALTIDELYEFGATCTNQYGNLWPGGLAWLHLHPDDTEIRALWEKRLAQSIPDFQSPAGFFYERQGPDFGYTLGTHETNIRGVWPYVRDTPRAATFIATEKKWFDWLSWNIVLQPGADWFAVNHAIETRQQHPLVRHLETPMAEHVPVARALSLTRETRAATIAAERTRLAKDWPGVAPLKVGNRTAFIPYLFQDRRSPAYYPTDAERDAALATLPWLARDRFNHARHDDRPGNGGADFLYLRRPAYYAAFASGQATTKQQRYGLTLLWRPDTGVILAGQSRVDGLVWGTYGPGAPIAIDSRTFRPVVTISKNRIPSPLPAAADLPDGDLVLRYKLAFPRNARPTGDKTVKFADDAITVAVRFAGPFSEKFPFVVAKDETVSVEDHTVTVRGPSGPRITLSFQGATQAPSLTEAPCSLPGRRIVCVQLAAADKLDYSLRF
ncbi:hypothetical protein OPIT5_14595 [Opitutaceae bacterium TAV5]|nr:hypothetical protein OPIT5_14595 [Opitutaceae bacterium TAV5]